MTEANSDEQEAQRRIAQVASERSTRLDLEDLEGLTELPSSIADLPYLEALDFSFTSVSVLPAWLGGLTNLVDLKFAATPVSVLPDFIGELTNLEYLQIGGTQVSELPNSLRKLTNLRGFAFWRTHVSVLPEWIGELAELSFLDLDSTLVSVLPNSLGELTGLMHLSFSPGRITSPPPEISSQGTYAVLDFLRSLQQDGGREEWRSKLVVAGEAKAGKTSLIRALLDEPHDPREKMTHGVRVVDIPITHPERADVEMHLSAWDFGGQRTYRSAHRFYMSDQSLFILAFNCREEWDDRRMREWLKAMTARARTSPILLVGTHYRQHRHGLPLETLRVDFPQIVPTVFYIDCDEEDGARLGIEDLREAIARYAAQLPLMGVRWPRPWLDAVQAVIDLPGDHASYEYVNQTMQAAGLDSPETRAFLLAALHFRGEILHFANERAIADTVVLHPMWVDGHVTKILDSADVHDRSGLLSRAELRRVWPDTSRELSEHLLGLMEAFDLAYRVDSGDNDDLCLIVDRLPHDPPSYQAVWDAAANADGASEVRLIIDFGGPVLLAGIPTWFIAREHRFTTNTHWRYGALLLDHFSSGCHALAVAHDDRGTVELAVRGLAPVRFLSVLKDGLLTSLQQRYPYLSWNIHIPCPCSGDRAVPCTGKFEETYLDKVAAIVDRTTVECRVSLKPVSIDLLRYGLRPASLAQIAAELKSLAHGVDNVDHVVNNIERNELAALDFQRAATALQQAQSQGCPSVFTLTKQQRRYRAGTSYRLRLFCEQPNEWHPLPGDQGVFTFAKKPIWLDKCAPYLRILLSVLQHALPLVGPVAGLAGTAIEGPAKSPARYIADLWSDERRTQELELMRQLLDGLPDLGDEKGSGAYVSDALVLGGRAPLRRAHDYADFRELRRSLDALTRPGMDPWGGLSPMITPEGIAIFVCKEHAKQYQFPVRP